MVSVNFAVGFAQRDISPKLGLELAGFETVSPRKCDDILDPLFVKVLLIDDGKHQSVIVAYDSLGLDYEIVKEIKKCVSNRSTLGNEDILISATHTHSAPSTISMLGNVGRIDGEYVQDLVKKTNDAFEEAASDKLEAKLYYGFTSFDWNMNRRPFHSENAIDPMVAVIRMDTSKKGIILFSYACHPVILSNTIASSDYVGYARSKIEETNVLGKEHTFSLFLNGCAGNINPYNPLTKQPLAFAGASTAQEMGAELGQVVNKLIPNTSPLPEIPIVNKLISIAKLDKNTKSEKTVNLVDIQLMEFASMRLVAIPGEPFVETGLWIKAKFGIKTLPIGYANGNIGYIPTPEAYDHAAPDDYEVYRAQQYYGIKVPRELEPAIREAVESLVANS